MPWKGHNRHVFLFRNHLVICKPRRDSRTDTFSYVFRNMMKVCVCRGGQGLCRIRGCAAWVGGLSASRALVRCSSVAQVHPSWVPHYLRVVTLSPQLSSIDLNDQVEGDDRAFEVWHEREDSVRKYLLQARTVIIKNSWVKEICGIQQRLAQPVWREYSFVGHSGQYRMRTVVQLGCTLAVETLSLR